MFQFHEGPIKTAINVYLVTLENCFNSMKVRLKPVALLVRVVVFCCFNSMKVRLKHSIACVYAVR